MKLIHKRLAYTIFIVMSLYTVGCWLLRPSASFESSDENWADHELQLKDRDLTSMIYFFSLYKVKCGAENVVFYRTTGKQLLNIFHWPSYLFELKWQVPFKEPSSKNGRRVYPDYTANHCFNYPQTELAVNRALELTNEHLEALKKK